MAPSTPLTACSMGIAHGGRHHFGAGPGIAGGYLDGGRHDGGVLRHRQDEKTHQSQNDGDQAMTLAKMGLSMKNSEIMGWLSLAG